MIYISIKYTQFLLYVLFINYAVQLPDLSNFPTIALAFSVTQTPAMSKVKLLPVFESQRVFHIPMLSSWLLITWSLSLSPSPTPFSQFPLPFSHCARTNWWACRHANCTCDYFDSTNSSSSSISSDFQSPWSTRRGGTWGRGATWGRGSLRVLCSCQIENAIMRSNVKLNSSELILHK